MRVGMESSGHSRGFERLLPEQGFELWIGDPAEIRTKRVRKQKTDRQDAQLLLRLMMEDRFPRIWVPDAENRDPQRQAPRPLPVLRPADKLPEPSEVLSGRRKDLEEVAQSPHAREPDDVGEIQTAPSQVSFALASDSTSLDVPGEPCLRNPLREICTVGSVGEETSRWCHGRPKRARSWKRRIQPRKTYTYRDSFTRRDGDSSLTTSCGGSALRTRMLAELEARPPHRLVAAK